MSPYRTPDVPFSEKVYGRSPCVDGSYACERTPGEHGHENCGIEGCDSKQSCLKPPFLLTECEDGLIRLLCVRHRHLSKMRAPWPKLSEK